MPLRLAPAWSLRELASLDFFPHGSHQLDPQFGGESTESVKRLDIEEDEVVRPGGSRTLSQQTAMSACRAKTRCRKPLKQKEIW